MKRYAVHKTSSAPASRTTGAVALALAVTAFLAKRFGLIEADVFVLSLLAAALIAITAVLLAITAFQRIWTYGGPGLPSALGGVFLATLALVPPALVLSMLVTHGGANDLSTDRVDPPLVKIRAVEANQPFLTWLNDRMTGEIWPAVLELAEISQPAAGKEPLYSDIVPRRYRIAPAQLHTASAKALAALHWTVVDELPPDLLDAPTRLQAEEATRILGLKHDIALRIRPDPVGALLDVRSRSRTPLRDLQGNRDNIRNLFAEIDQVLLATYGDLDRLTVEESELEDAELPSEPLEEPRETIPLPAFKPYFEEEEDPSADDLRLSDLEG
ncbi:DUF1499 domain-containing protein [Roseibium sp.]|uniref:DUF1499 domain-containing protein n=1 Tax=Roseibium sp. TaxID=1936156 RepID=UPI003D0D1741